MQHGKRPFGKQITGLLIYSHSGRKAYHLNYVQPWFLDGNWTTQFRGGPHIDGSFLAKANDYLPSHPRPSIIRLDWGKDPTFQDGGFFDFVQVVSPDKIWEILEKGKQYAKSLEEDGKLACLPRKLYFQRRCRLVEIWKKSH